MYIIPYIVVVINIVISEYVRKNNIEDIWYYTYLIYTYIINLCIIYQYPDIIKKILD